MSAARFARRNEGIHGVAVINRLLLLAAMVTLVGACGAPHAPLTHDAYVWQRQWTPGLRDAVDASSDLVRAWHVLVAQADRDGRFHGFAPDRDTLARSRRPVVLVVRIDGRLARFDPTALTARIVSVVQDWPGAAGLEIDYDCPTARLPAYTAFLRDLKSRLPGVPLSITALPTWNGSTALDDLLEVPDDAVLQVHAVQAPQAGLFDPAVATAWIDAFARHTHKPFRVALPTYGSRVSWNADGSLLSVESEAAALAAGAEAAELYAAPSTVRDFVAGLNRHRPAGLVGLVWFRLPTPQDTRAWSLATWRGVVTGRLAVVTPRIVLQAGRGGDAPSDVIVDNPGDSDIAPPPVVRLPATCHLADGIDGYTLRRTAQALELVATLARPIPARGRRAIGWARCRPDSPPPQQGSPVS